MDVWGERIVYTEIPKKKHFFVDILDFEFSSLNLNIGVEYTPPPLSWLTVNFPLHIREAVKNVLADFAR